MKKGKNIMLLLCFVFLVLAIMFLITEDYSIAVISLVAAIVHGRIANKLLR